MGELWGAGLAVVVGAILGWYLPWRAERVARERLREQVRATNQAVRQVFEQSIGVLSRFPRDGVEGFLAERGRLVVEWGEVCALAGGRVRREPCAALAVRVSRCAAEVALLGVSISAWALTHVAVQLAQVRADSARQGEAVEHVRAFVQHRGPSMGIAGDRALSGEPPGASSGRKVH